MLMNVQTLSVESPSVMAATEANFNVIGFAGTPVPAITQILAGVREDVARLGRVLCQLNCDATIRSADGLMLLAISKSSGAPLAATPVLRASIYDAQGGECAAIDLVTREIDSSETLTKLLLALIESAARAITERLFRITYRAYWIMAARSHCARHAILVAVDRDCRLVGADRAARSLLESKGCPFGLQSSLSEVFALDAPPFKESECDAVLELFGCDDGAPYSVLVTPPDRSPHRSHDDECVLLHVRPRLDTMRVPRIKLPSQGGAAGLAPRLLRRIQQYINTNLDSSLNVEDLAGSVGLSVSYFSRAFAKSVGTTPHSYVVRHRVLRAQKLLTETNLNLAEIALTTGFSDQSHFCRRFRQLVGLSPRAFRQSRC